MRQGYDSFRVAAKGEIVEVGGGSQLSATIDLIGRRYLAAFRVFLFGFLAVSLVFVTVIAAAKPSGDAVGALPIVAAVIGFVFIVEWFWRRALRMAGEEGQMLSEVLQRVANDRGAATPTH